MIGLISKAVSLSGSDNYLDSPFHIRCDKISSLFYFSTFHQHHCISTRGKGLYMLINLCHHMVEINLIMTICVDYQYHHHRTLSILIIYIYLFIRYALCKEKDRLASCEIVTHPAYTQEIFSGFLSL